MSFCNVHYINVEERLYSISVMIALLVKKDKETVALKQHGVIFFLHVILQFSLVLNWYRYNHNFLKYNLCILDDGIRHSA